MTDIAQAAGPTSRRFANERTDAFRAAGRHSARVRFLRRLVLLTAVGGSVLVLAFAFFNPFRAVVPSVSIGGVGLDGGRIAMEHPKLQGFRADGRPYELVAARALQDPKVPSALELVEIDAHVTMADKSTVHIVSERGLYNSSKETMEFHQPVHLTSDNGLDAHMTGAFVDFKSGSVETHEPLTVVMNSSTVSADAMHMVDNGRVVTFEGHVHTVSMPAGTAAATAATLKGDTQ